MQNTTNSIHVVRATGIIDTPFNMIPTHVHDHFLDGIDILNFEKSVQSQIKTVWNSLGSMFSSDSNDRSLTSNQADIERRAQQKLEEKMFPVETYCQLVGAQDKNHGVTIKTMTRVISK